jgi:fucose 4-O-acetylase-like acetyltransferase
MTRDPWLDNAKMALVVLVVVGHGWTVLPSDGVAARPYDFLYAWHMPAFVFVTGYLSRTFDYSRARMWRLVRTVVVPYVLFECAMALFRIHVGGEELEDLFADPHWPMWFLAALFFWRLLTPVFRPLWGGFAVAVALSIAAGLWAGDTLDMARVMGLLPFFVLGLKATPEHLEWLRGGLAKVLAAGVLVGILLLSAYTDEWASTEWLYYRAQYDEFAVSDVRAAVTRLVIIGIGIAGTFAFLALVPRVGGWFARMGAATLVVYLFHGFAVKGLEYAGYGTWAEESPWTAFLVVTAGAVALSLLLACHPVAVRLERLVDPFGLAERKVTDAVALTAAAEQAGSLPPMTDAGSRSVAR